MKDLKYKCNQLEVLEMIKNSTILVNKELIKEYENIGCNYCSGNYTDCKEYTPNYEVRR